MNKRCPAALCVWRAGAALSAVAAGSACDLMGLRMKGGCFGEKAAHFPSFLSVKAVLFFAWPVADKKVLQSRSTGVAGEGVEAAAAVCKPQRNPTEQCCPTAWGGGRGGRG